MIKRTFKYIKDNLHVILITLYLVGMVAFAIYDSITLRYEEISHEQYEKLFNELRKVNNNQKVKKEFDKYYIDKAISNNEYYDLLDMVKEAQAIQYKESLATEVFPERKETISY